MTYSTAALDAHAQPRSELLRQLSESDENKARAKAPVDVVAIYLGMLRRAPDASGYAFWVDYARRGHSLQSMINGFFGSPEYQARVG